MAQNPASLSLLAHPDTPSQAVRRVAATADWLEPHSLQFQYVVEADLRHVRIPAAVAGPGRADELWRHTCFEAFVRPAGSQRYLELNFSPSGEWAAYRFESYRRGMAPAALDEAPRLIVRGSEERLELRAQVKLSSNLLVPEASAISSDGDRRVCVALSAVVEDREGRLSYWALRHPPGKPDFHHPESFALALALRRT
jgi:hypothetical protein